MKFSGIYIITNVINGKYYIGKSVNVNSRLAEHRHHLRKGKHQNNHLQKAVDKYGMNNFTFELLEECDKDLLLAIEHYWVTILGARDEKYGYNINPTHPYGEVSMDIRTKSKLKEIISKNHPMLGKKHSKESKLIMSEKRKDYLQKNGNSQIGIPLSSDHKRKISETLTGKKYKYGL